MHTERYDGGGESKHISADGAGLDGAGVEGGRHVFEFSVLIIANARF